MKGFERSSHKNFDLYRGFGGGCFLFRFCSIQSCLFRGVNKGRPFFSAKGGVSEIWWKKRTFEDFFWTEKIEFGDILSARKGLLGFKKTSDF